MQMRRVFWTWLALQRWILPLKRLLISEDDLDYPWSLGEQVIEALEKAQNTGGSVTVTVEEWSGIIRSGGSQAEPKNTF